MGTVSYIKHLVSPKCRKFPFDGIIGWKLCHRVPTVEDLQERYAFTYYSTMNKAVTDVNNGSIGANEDATKDTAVAGVYTDENGGKNVVLLKDATENRRITLDADMSVNLGGNTLTIENDYFGFVGVKNKSITVNFAGVLNGSAVILNGVDGGGVAIKAYNNNRFVIRGGAYSINETVINDTYSAVGVGANPGGILELFDCVVSVKANGPSVGVQAQGDTTISNCDVFASSKGTQSYGVTNSGSVTISNSDVTVTCTGSKGSSGGVFNNTSGTATIYNCDIMSTSATGPADGLANKGTATISDCGIRGYSNYLKEGDNYTAPPHGIYNSGTLTINDCHVMGAHSGLENHGTLYVNGGTYESYGHGGFYFAADDAISYVRNATIRDCDMPDGYTATANRNGAGFYFGDCENGQVYMDNCEINGIAASQIFVIKGTNNTLHISNSTVNNTTGGDANVRIDDGGNMLYIGRGNNFTADNTNRPGAVIVTDEVYVQGVE